MTVNADANAPGCGAAQSEPLLPHRLSEHFSVGRAPAREEIKALAAAGFRSLINNRPDGEQGSSMTAAEARAVAEDAGLSYAHIPVEGRNPLEGDVRALEEALKVLPQPVYAYCRSGGRSAALWALASVTQKATGALLEACAQAGYDISGLETKMDMRREMLEEGDER